MGQWKTWGLLIAVTAMVGCSSGQAPSGVAPAAAPSAGDFSGTYVSFGHDTTTHQVFIEALRITQSGTGQFTGTLETTEVNQAGRTTPSSQNVTGTFDGHHATVALDVGIGHVNREATLAPNLITLSWMQNGQLATEAFARKSDAQYADMLQRLGHTATDLAATDAAMAKAQQANKETAQLTAVLQRFLTREATWQGVEAKAETRHKKVVAYGERVS